MSWGRDQRAAVAYDKAIAELWERHACGSPRGLRRARRAELADALDPRSVVAYLPGQYARKDFPFEPLSAKRRYAWKDGIDYATGRGVSVLADLVYYRGSLQVGSREKSYTSANTSGVAAFTDAEGAIRRATLELVERDAFMRAWLSRAATPAVRADSIPLELHRRLEALRAVGFRVRIKDLSGPLAPVLLVFAQHEARGFTNVTAHADFDPAVALEHALAELESLVMIRLDGGNPRPMRPEDVRTPVHHAELYAQRRFFRRADFLAGAGPLGRLAEVGRGAAATWPRLLDRLKASGSRLACVDMTPPGAGLGGGKELHVYRAIVPGLLPISFGYGTEALALPEAMARRAVASSEVRRGELKPFFPHPFA